MFRAAAFAVPILLVVFVVLYAAAAVAYPGGTWEEPQRSGHSFFFNYYCDLMRPTALNGQPNPVGSQLAELGQLVLALSFGPFFWVAPALFDGRPKLTAAVRALGLVACVAGVGVVLMPSWRFGQTVHGIMLLLCGFPAVAALVCVMVGTWQVPTLRALAAALVVTMLATIGIFVRQMIIGVESSPGLAPLQRIDFALALGWMATTSRRAERARRAGSAAL
ncbi:MAG: hypothetical protein JNK82_23595 [Myxococcaceae bacterium]|nr:hypothetical protein [Myxococcaceae bacterium]